jgi:hypothetical protein
VIEEIDHSILLGGGHNWEDCNSAIGKRNNALEMGFPRWKWWEGRSGRPAGRSRHLAHAGLPSGKGFLPVGVAHLLRRTGVGYGADGISR